MYLVGIEIDLLEMLEQETNRNFNFNPNRWSQGDIDRLKNVVTFLEKNMSSAIAVPKNNKPH